MGLIDSAFPVALDTAASFFPMKDAPKAVGVLTAPITNVAADLPIVDAHLKFGPGPTLVTITSTLEQVWVNLCDATGCHGCVRGVGSTLSNNGVAGTAAGAGAEVRQLLNHLQLAILGDAILALEVKVGIDGSADTDSLDFRVTTLEAAIAGSATSVVILAAPQAGCVDGDVVSFNGTNFIPFNINNAGTLPPIGVIEDIVGAAGTVVLAGLAGDFTGLTPGTVYYADPTTPGKKTATPSAWIIGVARAATTMMLGFRIASVTPITLSGQTINAGVSNRDLVYWDGTNSRWEKYASSLNRVPEGVAINISAGVGDVVIHGPVTGYGGLTVNVPYYATAVAGAVGTTKPATGQGWIAGYAQSAAIFYVAIHRDPIVTAAAVSFDDTATTYVDGANVQVALVDADAELGTVHTQFGLIDFDFVNANDPDTANASSANVSKLVDNFDIGALALHNHDARYGYGGLLDKRYFEEVATTTDPTNSWNVFVSYPGGVGPTGLIDADGVWNEFLTVTTPGPPAASRSMGNILRVWRDHLPDLLFHIKTVSTNSVRYWVALVQTSGNLGSASPATNLAGFRYDSSVDSGNAHWRCVTNDGGVTPTVTDSGVAIAGNTVYDFRIVVGASDVKFYINGTLVATHTTDLPTAGVDLTTSCYAERLGASERQIRFGWLKCRSK